MLLMADGVAHGGKSKIRHKNMADGVAENDGCHGGQKKESIYINSLKLKQKKDCIKIN